MIICFFGLLFCEMLVSFLDVVCLWWVSVVFGVEVLVFGVFDFDVCVFFKVFKFVV